MHTTTLGELTVSAQGLGGMGMSEFYGHTDWDESVAAIHRALDLGVTFLDTALEPLADQAAGARY